MNLGDGPVVAAKLAKLRGSYEPFVYALGQYFLFALPEVVPENPDADNWQKSALIWRPPGIGNLAATGGQHWHD